jgi:predicted nucleic acid-binding protein
MNFVLDCSVTIPWLLKDQADDYTEAVMDSLEDESALVPILWNYEVANTLITAQRKKLVSATEMTQFLEELRSLNILIQAVHDFKYDEMLVNLGTAYKLTAYDSAYLKLAMTEGLPMATQDKALKAACAEAGVALYKP